MRGGSIPGFGDDESIPGLLRYQARACGRVGSPLYELLLGRAADDFEAGGPTARILEGHEDDPVGSALALRLMGAVHRLVLEGRAPELAARYESPEGEPEETWHAFRATLEEEADVLRRSVDLPVQTNEVGRCAAFLPGFLEVASSTGLPLRLLEVGSSAGLNLRWTAYRYEAEGFSWGPRGSPVRIRYELRGGPMPAAAAADVEVAERRGCDPLPVDPTGEEGRRTLLSYLWPDQVERLERMRAALEVAEQIPVRVERGAAVEWISDCLSRPAPGRATVVFHSIVMQYLSEAQREEFRAALEEAGSRADRQAPLAWIGMEPDGEAADVRLTTWPGGEECSIARAGYHGNPVELRRA